ncbi:MAG: ArnT family glycosyltransferase [Acidimicrobiales bacterium]
MREVPTSPSPWGGPFLWIELVLTSLVLHLPGLVFALFSADEASTATLAISITRGGHLYQTVADRKPPLVPYLYAGVFWLTDSHDLRPVRVLGDLVLAATAILLAAEANRRYGDARVAKWVAVIFLISSVALLPDNSQAATFEMFMVLPMTAAFVAAGRGQGWRAGLFLALACLCKQTALAAALPIVYLLFRHGGWKPIARAFASGATILVATAMAFGPSRFILWNVTGNGGYLALHGSLSAVALNAGAQIGPFAAANMVVFWLCYRGQLVGRIDADLWLWLGSGIVAVSLGLRFFEHYFLQLLPPLALMAGAGLVGISAHQCRRWIAAAAGVPLILVALGFRPGWFNQEPALGPITTAVNSLAHPGQSIFVWGQLSELYWLTGRPPASRYILAAFLTGSSGGRQSGTAARGVPHAWTNLETDFARHPPAVIVDTSPAHFRSFGSYPLQSSAIWPFIESHYIAARTVDKMVLYELSSPSNPAPASTGSG